MIQLSDQSETIISLENIDFIQLVEQAPAGKTMYILRVHMRHMKEGFNLFYGSCGEASVRRQTDIETILGKSTPSRPGRGRYQVSDDGEMTFVIS